MGHHNRVVDKAKAEATITSKMKAPFLILLTCLALPARAGEGATSAPAPHFLAGALEAPAWPTPETPLDAIVFGQLKRIGIRQANSCSDAVFIRRVFLDVIGTLPTSNEARRFLQDRNPNKRVALVEQLLERDEFADYWAMKWANLLRVKSEFPINLWPNAVQAFHHWIRASIKQNLSYDQFVREMLTSSGSNIRKPQVNFYRAVQSKDPQTLAEGVALTFMGTRPETWSQERLTHLSVFFSRVGYKPTAEWKEEIVFFDLSKPPPPGTATLPDGKVVKLSPMQDPRGVFSDWLISPTNGWFTCNLVNRTWSWLLGRGIIHEPDDIRPDNPPACPELLAMLEQEFVASRYDFKQLLRLILNSRTYQLSCAPVGKLPDGAAFASYSVRRLEAEVLIDAINQVTGTTEKYISRIPEPFTSIPEEKPSVALADASVTSVFLDLFGRSPRNTGLESESRNNSPTAAQELHLLNSSHIRRKLEEGLKLRALLQNDGNAREMVDRLYLTILSRYPTPEELQIILSRTQASANPDGVGLELAWVLINTAEFQFRH